MPRREGRQLLPKHLRALERAAKRGEAFAQCNLGAHLASGDGVQQDLSRAVFWYRKAAAQKEPDAIYNLALMYMHGEGVAIDVTRGRRLLERAAQLGSPDAQQLLGEALVAGHFGMQRDPERAAYHYLRSLLSGYGRSALLLAIALKGRGKISRPQLSRALIQVAAEAGVSQARAILSERRRHSASNGPTR